MDPVCHLVVCKWTVGEKKSIGTGRRGSCTLKLRNWDKHRGKSTVGTFLFMVPIKSMKGDTITLGK